MFKHLIRCVKDTQICAAKRCLSQTSNQVSKKVPKKKTKRKVVTDGAVELDKLRTDVENSFGVKYEDQVLVHGVGFGKRGETLVYPLLNPDRGLQDVEGCDDAKEDRREAVQEDMKKVPGVSTILAKTKSMEALIIWKRKMIKKMGEEGFRKYQTEMLSQGQSHHTNIQSVLSGVPHSDITPDNAVVAGFWKSMDHVWPHISMVQCTEQHIRHPHLDYHGYVDCVAKYRGQLCVIDWKTSHGRRKPTLKESYDDPLQVAAYAGAINYDSNFKYEVSEGLIVHAYKDGTPADVLHMPVSVCQQYWSEWLGRLIQYREKTEKNL